MSIGSLNLQLNVEYSQEICDVLARETGCSLIICGEGGVILASSIAERIGTLHEVAAKIMTGQADEISVTAQEAGASGGKMREGINMGVDFEGQRFCNVGVGGALEIARKYASIVKLCVVAMLRSDLATVLEKHRLAERLEQLVDTRLGAIGELSGRLRRRAERMLNALEDTHARGVVVADLTEGASHSVSLAATAATQLSGSVQEIAKQMAETAAIAQGAVTESASARARMEDLGGKAQGIGEFVAIIKGISSQTNLLALNATIEAARAGDAGKGFAVVAHEVKSLAGETAKATERISEQVGGIQSETTLARGGMEQIGGTISRINELSTIVAGAVEEQSAASNQISANVEHAARGSAQVSKEIGVVLKMTEDAREGVRDVSAVAGNLDLEAEQLHDAVRAIVNEMKQS